MKWCKLAVLIFVACTVALAPFPASAQRIPSYAVAFGVPRLHARIAIRSIYARPYFGAAFVGRFPGYAPRPFYAFSGAFYVYGRSHGPCFYPGYAGRFYPRYFARRGFYGAPYGFRYGSYRGVYRR